MKRNFLFSSFLLTTSLLLLPKASIRAGEQVAPATAAEALAALLSALTANDVDRAVAMTTPEKNVTAESMREYYKRVAEHTREAGSAQVVAHLQLDDAAVVVIHERSAQKTTIVDLDPGYLVRRNGKWLVLYKFSYDDDREYLEFDEPLHARFRKLARWFEVQKPLLQALIDDEN